MCEQSELSELNSMIEVAQQGIRLRFALSELLSCGERSGKVAISPLFHQDDQDDQIN
jgi:hypothetical protein